MKLHTNTHTRTRRTHARTHTRTDMHRHTRTGTRAGVGQNYACLRQKCRESVVMTYYSHSAELLFPRHIPLFRQMNASNSQLPSGRMPTDANAFLVSGHYPHYFERSVVF